MNVELLEKVKKAILAEPMKFDMEDFKQDYRKCGTTYCIGGWVCLIGEAENFSGATAQRLLDITSDQAQRLFFGGVPGKFPNLWETPTDEASAVRIAKEAVERIDYFIEMGR